MPRLGGKKVSIYEFRTSTQQHKIDIKLNTQSGEFNASFGSEYFHSTDLVALKQMVLEAAQKADDTKFEQVIAYRVRGGKEEGEYDLNGRNTVGVECYVLLLSTSTDKHGDRYMVDAFVDPDLRFITKKQEARRYHSRYTGEKFIAYTVERWVALRGIQDAIQMLASKLSKTLEEGSPEEIEANFEKLTSISGILRQKMLPA